LYTATNNLGNPFVAARVVFDTTAVTTNRITVTNAINNSLQLTGGNPTIGMVGTGNARIGGFTTPGALVLDNAAPAADLQILSLNGANTIPGGVTLHRGNLEVASNNALGAGTFTVAGGTLRSSGSVGGPILSNPVVLTADLVHLGGDNATTELTFTQSAVISGAGGFAHRGQGTVTIQSASTYAGPTVVRETPIGYRFGQSDADGILALSGASGSVLGSSEVVVTGGGTLRLDNSAGSNYDRLGNATPVTLRGGYLVFAAGPGGVEQAGPLTLSGSSVIQAGQTATGPEAGLTFASLSRGADRGTVLFRGDNLGSTARIRFGSGPVADLVGGGGAAGSTTVSVLPYAAALTNTGSWGNTFVTYDAAGGVRPLTTAEFATALPVGQVTAQNVRLDANATVSSPTTVNGLLLRDDGTFPAAVTVGGTATLAVTSGLVVSVHQNDRIDAPLAFGPREGHLVAARRLNVGGAMTGSGGVTVSGGGEVNLTGTNTGLTGPLTVNGGTVSFAGPANLPGTGPIVLGGGSLAIGGADAAVLLYTGPINSSVTLDRGLRLVGQGRIATLGSVNGPTVTLSGPIDGPGTLLVGNGEIILTQPNTHTGGTVVSGFANGMLVAANPTGSATGTGPVFLRSNGTLAGNGRVAGVVVAEPNGTTNPDAAVAPSGPAGTGIGRLTVGGLDLRQGVYQWQLGGLSESGPGVNFDQLVVEGAGTRLDPAGRVTLDFALLAAGDRPTAPGSGAGFWAAPRQWLILDWTGEGDFSGSFGGVSNPTWGAGTFGLSQQGGDVYLTFIPVPEPGAGLAAGAAGLGAAGLWRRRRRRTGTA
jgi:autotransporter-associated beta strand protein